MTEITFLNGRVLKKSLPVIKGRPEVGAPRLKRLMLNQGELAQFHSDERGIRYIAAVELRPGAVRGNHYHHRKEEFLYVITGELELTVEDISSKERVRIPMVEGDLGVVPVRVAHAIRATRSGFAVEFSPATFEPTDAEAYKLA
jgi:mannose-6-phosphate isomerase-like protein (cupin superfamily)